VLRALSSTHRSETQVIDERITVDGKFFRAGSGKFHAKGITYGPFAPNAEAGTFASREQTRRDFEHVRQLNANVVRVYHPPPAWVLDAAAEFGLRLLIDVPWPKHLCFLDSKELQCQAVHHVREAVRCAAGHPAVFAFSLVNEISAEIVRWSGVRRVEKFVDRLVAEAKSVEPGCLCTFASFPPTEFLRPQAIDFVCFNVYLHQRPAFEAYLARLQSLAEHRPLVLGEFGMDSVREGELRKCEFLQWQVEAAFNAGLAGTVLFSYTDDWFRGGTQIEDWSFGLTLRDRSPKPSFEVVRRQYASAPRFPLPRLAKVSVVVATFNGGRTIQACLNALTRLNYPDCEIIVVDDGSTDSTPEIAARFPSVRYIRQNNSGLSAARNTGIAAASGEIVAFTDDDCRPDEDWLHYLIGDLLRSDFAAIGGHNFLPPDDSPVAAAVAASPGGPAHVMLTDREAEHIPGCNMAFYKWALEEIGGFDPTFRKAGDDVDVCWRLQAQSRRIGFSAAGFVWHYRRATVKAYLKQQAGYGEAEALLARKHPEYFNSFGGGIWKGRIYATAAAGVVLRAPVIYHGVFASGFFQRLYAGEAALPVMLCTTLLYHVFVNAPLLALTLYFEALWPLAAASLGFSLGICVLAGVQANIPRDKCRWWSRPLVAVLFSLQPIIRGWNRLKVSLNLEFSPRSQSAPPVGRDIPDEIIFWSDGHGDRFRFLQTVQEMATAQKWPVRLDTGWTRFDMEILASAWNRARLVTVTEELGQGRCTIRCRLDLVRSARMKLALLALTVITAGIIASFREALPWVWMALVTVPIVLWLAEEDRAVQQASVAALLESAATEAGLIHVKAQATVVEQASATPAPTDTATRVLAES
jgi:O-antigen biosynthesis protein